jgi:D-alanyl-lipoteichoic acid acyltransferase DltB (MBOAT superfamily)
MVRFARSGAGGELQVLFNSFQFWGFLALVLVLYRSLDHRWQNRMLLVASYFFYGCWDWRFLSLIFVSTLIDYHTGLRIHASDDPRRRKHFLLLSLIFNLGGLGIFKYYGFFAHEFSDMVATLGVSSSLPALNIILPVGISFYTFQTLSYTIDIYRGKLEPTQSFLDFALYVSFFPQLVAGPIERSSRLLPQIIAPRERRRGDFREGLQHILIGLFKKVVIADNMAYIVNGMFNSTTPLSGAEWLVALYAFAFQIYGDFSGYSSIAIGVSKWLGVDLMTNFDTPYFATSIRDFWRRWHISLSTWLRDYLYVPLGGNRNGNLMTYRNLMLTMLLGGLWHGAAWTFIVWGALQGALLSLDRLSVEHGLLKSEPSSTLGRCISILVTFHLVCLSWLVFRAESMTQVWTALSAIFTDFRITEIALGTFGIVLFYAGPLVVYEAWIQKHEDPFDLSALQAQFTHQQWTRAQWAPRVAAYGYCILMMALFAPIETNEFIYFQF